MYEPIIHPPIPPNRFIMRMFRHFAAAVIILLVSVAIGMTGYTYFEDLDWRSAFLNSAMLLGGMGPVDGPITNGGKLFAGIYALYAGLVFIVIAGLIFAPLVHRVMHKLHWEQDQQN